MSVRARRTASYLVGAEVAFAMMLLVGAGFVLRTFAALLAVDPGFHYDHLLRTSIALPAAQYKGVETREGFYARALPALAAIPDVESVGAAAVTPLTGNNWTVGLERVDRPLPAGQHAPDVGWQVASGGFFPTLGIPLIDGRLFNDADSPAGRPVAIVSKALADQYFPRERAVGHQILVNDSATEIIGVVGDIRRAGLRDAPRPELYLPFERSPSQQISLFVRTRDDPLNARAATEASLRRIEPQILLTGTDRVADLISDSVRSARLLVWLLGTFAAVALVLALIGIYGVLAYAVRLRAREIGTRIALGAPRGAIVRLVMAEGLGIATAGAMIGVGAGLVCGRLARSVLFETSAVDPMVLGGAPAILLLMAALACYIPARRAAAIDPARTLGQP